MSAQLMLPTHTPRITQKELFEQVREAERFFEALSEQDQMLYLARQKIGFCLRDETSRENTARLLLTKNFGPKFADRVLTTPELRKKVGLDLA